MSLIGPKYMSRSFILYFLQGYSVDIRKLFTSQVKLERTNVWITGKTKWLRLVKI